MSLLKNSSIVIAGVVVSNILAYIFHFIAGRILGPKEYGDFGALMALSLQFALPASAIGSAIAKYTSQYETENSLGRIFSLRKRVQNHVLIFILLVFVLILLFSKTIALYFNINSSTPIIIAGFNLIFSLLYSINFGVLQGMKKFTTMSWVSVLEAFSRIIIFAILMFFGLRLNASLLAFGLAYLIAYFLILFTLKKARIESSYINPIEIKLVYRFALLTLLTMLISQSILNIPSILIRHYYSSEFTGYWVAAMNIAKMSMFVTGAITTVMFPEMISEKDNKAKAKILKRAYLLSFISSFILALVFFVAPNIFVSILYGPKFEAASEILKWLGFPLIFLGILQLWMTAFLTKLR